MHNQFWHLRIPTRAEESKKGVVYPVAAVRYLKEIKFSGNLMVPFNVGAYVSWKLFPDVKVSLDSRFEVAYPVQAAVENIMFYAAQRGWQKTLTKYPTDAILIPRWSKLDQVMSKNNGGLNNKTSPTWTRVYIDNGYSLYVRSDLANKFPLTDMRGKPITASFP